MDELKPYRFASSPTDSNTCTDNLILETAIEAYTQVQGMKPKGCSTASHFMGNDESINGVTYLAYIASGCFR
jgi:hypothetical protein